MRLHRLTIGRSACGSVLAILALALAGGGCESDWGMRSGPSLDDIGEGLLAFGAMIGAGVGFCALTEAGGGANMDYLGTTASDHNYYDPWRGYSYDVNR